MHAANFLLHFEPSGHTLGRTILHGTAHGRFECDALQLGMSRALSICPEDLVPCIARKLRRLKIAVTRRVREAKAYDVVAAPCGIDELQAKCLIPPVAFKRACIVQELRPSLIAAGLLQLEVNDVTCKEDKDLELGTDVRFQLPHPEKRSIVATCLRAQHSLEVRILEAPL